MARYMTKREAIRKRAWFRAIAGLVDFFASIGSFIVILLCVALLTQMFVWLKGDITQTLYSLESVATSAIVQPREMQAAQIEGAPNVVEQPVPAPQTYADLEDWDADAGDDEGESDDENEADGIGTVEDYGDYEDPED